MLQVEANEQMDKINARIADRNVEVVLGKSAKRAYDIRPFPNPSPLQLSIFKNWLRPGQ
jgi:hypothetical protein